MAPIQSFFCFYTTSKGSFNTANSLSPMMLMVLFRCTAHSLSFLLGSNTSFYVIISPFRVTFFLSLQLISVNNLSSVFSPSLLCKNNFCLGNKDYSLWGFQLFLSSWHFWAPVYGRWELWGKDDFCMWLYFDLIQEVRFSRQGMECSLTCYYPFSLSESSPRGRRLWLSL